MCKRFPPSEPLAFIYLFLLGFDRRDYILIPVSSQFWTFAFLLWITFWHFPSFSISLSFKNLSLCIRYVNTSLHVFNIDILGFSYFFFALYYFPFCSFYYKLCPFFGHILYIFKICLVLLYPCEILTLLYWRLFSKSLFSTIILPLDPSLSSERIFSSFSCNPLIWFSLI